MQLAMRSRAAALTALEPEHVFIAECLEVFRASFGVVEMAQSLSGGVDLLPSDRVDPDRPFPVRTRQFDPLLPFKIGPVNGRDAPRSGRSV
jgi:hypothetical protein